mmetsp:Transcript_87842/g.243659  ORF Transcript_87842/g.243659 Transcript_87842/m.243659 type:complete len:211 (-) Transcript_87842:147-779(-)
MRSAKPSSSVSHCEARASSKARASARASSTDACTFAIWALLLTVRSLTCASSPRSWAATDSWALAERSSAARRAPRSSPSSLRSACATLALRSSASPCASSQRFMPALSSSTQRRASSPCRWRSSRSPCSSALSASTSLHSAASCCPATFSKRCSSSASGKARAVRSSCRPRRASARSSPASAWTSAYREASPVSRAVLSHSSCSSNFAA